MMGRIDPARWRDRFPILADSTYLMSHSLGAMPRGAADALAEYTRAWREEGIAAYGPWMETYAETVRLVEGLLNAPEGTVVFHQNVSTLMGILISAIHRPGGRRKVVTTALNFPSVYYGWKLHEALGLEVVLLESPDGVGVPVETVTAAIDDDTLAVVIDHGIFRSGYLMEVPPIVEAARAAGAYTVIDAYQTVGTVPVDVAAWGADFVLGGSHKWLCGGPGASWMYIRKDLISELTPRVAGWFGHARPFDFDLKIEFAPTAMRFATGTPNIPGIYAARTGIGIVSEVGLDAIRAHSLGLTDKLIDACEREGLTVRTPREHDRRGGVVCIDFPGAERAEEVLLPKRIFVDYRPGCGVRVSPHFYTTEEELLSIVPEFVQLRDDA